MEKETPKTAEELIRSISINRANLQYIIDHNRINGSLLHDIKHIMEEYAEQARREERERHEEIITMLKRVTEVYIKSYPVDVKIAIEDDLEHALAAAGYGKEEK